MAFLLQTVLLLVRILFAIPASPILPVHNLIQLKVTNSVDPVEGCTELPRVQ